MNKQKLAQYTCTETETIAIKGETKYTKVYNVQMMNGQEQITEVSNQKAQQGGARGTLEETRHVKKTEEYRRYGQQIAANNARRPIPTA